MFKINVSFQKLDIKWALSNVCSALLAFVHLDFTVKEPKAIKSILDFILFINRYADVVVNISTLKTGSLPRSNIRLLFK